jgi:hypothetical protein
MFRNPGMQLCYNFFMKLAMFDKERAKSQAKQFLAKSIYTLGILLDQDTSLIDENTPNPYNPSSSMYYGFETLKSEILAYNKL